MWHGAALSSQHAPKAGYVRCVLVLVVQPSHHGKQRSKMLAAAADLTFKPACPTWHKNKWHTRCRQSQQAHSSELWQLNVRPYSAQFYHSA